MRDTKQVYFITFAASPEDATEIVESFVEERAEREFFEFAELAQPEKCILLDEIREDLQNDLETLLNEIVPKIENDIILYKENGNRLMEGNAHIRLGNIMSEHLCEDMPFYNIDEDNWNLSPVIKRLEDQQWYAVLVELSN